MDNINEKEKMMQTPSDENSSGSEKESCPEDEYIKRYSEFSSFYLYLVAACGIIIACGIAVAVIVNLFIGLIMAISGPVVYWFFNADELRKKLGIRYKTTSGTFAVTECHMTYGHTFYLPSTLMWYEVTELGDSAFSSKKNSELREIYLPSTLKKIGKDAFGECNCLEKIHFEGSEELWDKIEKQTEIDKAIVEFGAKFPPIPKKEKKNKKKTETTEKSAG